MMTNAHNESNERVSDWTLATGTKPGERHVYHAVSKTIVRPPVAETRP
jgi:hypothetical protein